MRINIELTNPAVYMIWSRRIEIARTIVGDGQDN